MWLFGCSDPCDCSKNGGNENGSGIPPLAETIWQAPSGGGDFSYFVFNRDGTGMEILQRIDNKKIYFSEISWSVHGSTLCFERKYDVVICGEPQLWADGRLFFLNTLFNRLDYLPDFSDYEWSNEW
jgi:hypothetical protein